MMSAGWERLLKSLIAMRRISWIDQRISGGEVRSSSCARLFLSIMVFVR